MKYDEFSFFNQQLAGMLRSGIPLEPAIKQLCAGMTDRQLSGEIEALHVRLKTGEPLGQALAASHLPEFYKRMVEVGVKSDDLPGVLLMVADHYTRANLLWTRLKGLMVYPLLVISLSLLLTIALAVVFGHFMRNFFTGTAPFGAAMPLSMSPMVAWIPTAVMITIAMLGIAMLAIPQCRASLRWRLPGFREATLAQLASAMGMMLKRGTTLSDALGLAENMETNASARAALSRWRGNVQSGLGKPNQWPALASPFPPMFLWLVQKGGEDAGTGFMQAAEMYERRANYQIEMALYGALPVSIIFLGQLVLWQVAPLMNAMAQIMRSLGDAGGG